MTTTNNIEIQELKQFISDRFNKSCKRSAKRRSSSYDDWDAERPQL